MTAVEQRALTAIVGAMGAATAQVARRAPARAPGRLPADKVAKPYAGTGE